jgi:hypothetical protein
LAAFFISNQAPNVAYWHLTDIPAAPAFVRFRTTADKGGFWPAMVCPLMTLNGSGGTPRRCDAHLRPATIFGIIWLGLLPRLIASASNGYSGATCEDVSQ